MIDTWKEVYTKSQRENLVEKTVASLTELVNIAKKEGIIKDTTLGYLHDDSLSPFRVFLSRNNDELMESNLLRDKIILEKDYGRIVEQYKLEPKKIEEVMLNLKNK